MNIKELKRNKKNRNLVLYLRKVVESYRAGFVSSKELKTDLHMDFKRVRQLNRWYFKHRILPYLKPKRRKLMKPEINKTKDLEAKIKWLEKENEMLRMKSIAWETLVDIAEKQFDISIKKKFVPKPLNL
jgi:transposase